MSSNYIKSAWRNLDRHRVNGGINIAGLAIGIACVILITLYILDELKFDRFFGDARRIYQVNIDANFGGQQYVSSGTPPPVGAALHAAFPEISGYTRTYALGNEVVSAALRHFSEKRILGADSNYLRVFDYALREGNPLTCLTKPGSIVITESMAKKYFGQVEGVLGKTLVLDQGNQPFFVTAVLRDLPAQSSQQFDMLIPMANCPGVKHFSWSWIWCQMTTFVELSGPRSKASLKALESRFPAMVRVQAASAFQRIGQPFDEFLRKGGKWDFHLQPITDVHLYSSSIGTNYTNLGNIQYVYIFSAIALFIILLACVNFMNLSTAQASARAKEVGVRKALGSMHGQLIRQFLSEAMLYSGASTIIALGLVALLLPLFNQVSGKSLNFLAILHDGVWLMVIGLCLITGLLAGSYPAFYLTSFNPIAVLKGTGLSDKKKGHLNTRNGLVVFQFTVSIALIICTIVVFQQLRYTRTKDLGLRRENVLILHHAEKMQPGTEEALRQALLQTPGVTGASITSDVPGADFYGFTDFYTPVQQGTKESLAKDVTLTTLVSDEYLVPTLHLQLLQGRNFSKSFSDSSSVIVNEATVRQVGWKQPLGKYLVYPGKDNESYKVIGVIRDFNAQSLYSAVTPMALFHVSSKTYQASTSYLLVGLQGGDPTAILASFQQQWNRLTPSVPFEYTWLDNDFDALYRSDRRMGTVFGIFTGLSILVSCMGLLGLSMYTAVRRTKEIGVRKVLGASTGSLVILLSRDFLRLVLAAALVAFPLAWWTMSAWLQDFVYRITIEWWVFGAAAAMAVVIALATMSFHAVKAALANPAKSLRTE